MGMKAVVAASKHWMNVDTIRECLVNLPVGSTVIVSNRSGGDALVAKIAAEELALHVELFDADKDDNSEFRKKIIDHIDADTDSAFFFCCDNREVEFFISKYARTVRVPTEVVIQSFSSV
tara:strand:+ start:177 stop:536 length:360 start_codon:yes stop_codon:yes gene_type:complete